jgi:two-component system response regulator AtoC
MPRILLAEDDEIMRITLYDRLRRNKGWQVDDAENGTDAMTLIEKNVYHLVISDIRMPGLDGMGLMEQIKRLSPATDVILMTAYGSVADAVACLKNGAADYILKPFDMDDLAIRAERLLAMQTVKARCASLEETSRQPPIIGQSKAITEVFDLIKQVATTDTTVLVTGESGTGKELVAAAIHFQSKRAAGPYIRINCPAIPETLMESELFGFEKGAFTGAQTKKTGKFEMADNGTILLDEIGDMPMPLQSKLLRVLQEREIERIGGSKPIPINVRIICSTAKKLNEEVQAGRFRQDLFYRLQVIPIEVPPLRGRRDDIPLLCRHFLSEFSIMRGMPLELSPEALQRLTLYDFPGNVRELRNIIERAAVLTPTPLIESDYLPADLAEQATAGQDETLQLATAVAWTEKNCISRALLQTGGNKTEAAKLLGISRKNLWEKIKLHRIGLQNDS